MLSQQIMGEFYSPTRITVPMIQAAFVYVNVLVGRRMLILILSYPDYNSFSVGIPEVCAKKLLGLASLPDGLDSLRKKGPEERTYRH